jgi:large subunit ribosomal protein L25
METLQLEVRTRDTAISPAVLRRERIIPAVFYGRGLKPQVLQVNYPEFRKVFLKSGSNQIIDLSIDGKSKAKVLVHDVQYYPLTGAVSHVDFINVRMTEEITTHVPVEITGVAPAVKDMGGVLTKVKHDVEVKCLPMDIPSKIVVNVEMLVDFSCSIHVKDLVLPKGVKVMDNVEDAVVTVTAPRKEEEITPAAPATGIEGTAAELAAKEEAAKAAEAGAAPAAGGKAKEDKK